MPSVSPFSLASPAAIGAVAFNKVGASANSFLNLLRTGAMGGSTGSASVASPSNLPSSNSPSQTLLDQFKQTLQLRLSLAGIDRSQPIHLSEDNFGHVVADPSHPEHLEIQQLFQDDPSLANQFHQLAASYIQAPSSGDAPAVTSSPAGVQTDAPPTQGFSLTLTGNQIAVTVAPQ